MKIQENHTEQLVYVDAQDLFCQAENLINSGKTAEAFRLLAKPLNEILVKIRKNSDAIARVTELAREHGLFGLTQLDPYTRRAHEKPRGYPGDAVMLDYVYAGVPPSETSAIGREIFTATARGPMGLSVVFRKELLRSYINDVISRKPDARILCVASGHCRELEGSYVESPLFSGEFIAFDQDPLSCDEVRWQQNAMRGNSKVKVIHSAIRNLISGQHNDLGQFDFIYAAGLYDYLPVDIAQRLTKSLGNACTQDGRLLIANFTPDGYGRAYMELFMDWHLIVRSEPDMESILRCAEMPNMRTFRDPHDNVVYAETW